MKLMLISLTKFLIGLLLVAALIFIPAGSLSFTNGWLFIALLFIPMLILGVILLIKSPALLEKRLNAKEEKSTQKGVVAASGLYGIVRHPMYAVTIWLFLAIPIVLGSLWAFLCFVPYVAVIVVRILDEEKLLEKELSGYTEYKKKVKYRLLPFVW